MMMRNGQPIKKAYLTSRSNVAMWIYSSIISSAVTIV